LTYKKYSAIILTCVRMIRWVTRFGKHSIYQVGS